MARVEVKKPNLAASCGHWGQGVFVRLARHRLGSVLEMNKETANPRFFVSDTRRLDRARELLLDVHNEAWSM